MGKGEVVVKGSSRERLNEIEIVEHVWIEMSDGVRLSAKMWLPENALDKPVPAILEFIPYRKRDACVVRDHKNHAWFASRGYVCIRPDMRGHGDSEGLMHDEYSPREQQDAVEVIAWLSEQSWCDGNVGMMGISWGGIASLQATVHQPPSLKAIIPVGFSVDRYYDDGGYLLGCYPGEGLGWGGVMFGYCIRPPDPGVVGDVWRRMWFDRLEQTPMFAEKWMSHQLRDETWIQGSVCEEYDKVQTPILGIGAWNDCFPNSVIRLLENVKAPCRVVSGPWGHVYPNLGGPGPKIGFLQLALDWWDHWLKGVENGVMDAPAFLAYLQDSHRPDPHPSDRLGRWVAEESWPSPNITNRHYGFKVGCLLDDPSSSSGIVEVCSPLSLGLATGEYMPISGSAELPQDQRSDDVRSACFDSEPLTDKLEILGTTYLHLRISSDCSCGMVAVRLCDVAPDGASTLICYGTLNLKQREGREKLAEIIPNQEMDVSVRLNDIGWSLRSGHRLRVAISSQLWPMAWPQPEQSTLKIYLENCSLDLPTRNQEVGHDPLNPFEPAESAELPPMTRISPPSSSRDIHHDLANGKIVYEVKSDDGKVHFQATDLTYSTNESQTYSIVEGDPLSAHIEYRSEFSFAREGWIVETKSEFTTTCDDKNFILKGRITAFENNEQVYTRDWDVKIPRLVF